MHKRVISQRHVYLDQVHAVHFAPGGMTVRTLRGGPRSDWVFLRP
jgi:hypothetical protein